MPITGQRQFNQTVSGALRNLYLLSIKRYPLGENEEDPDVLVRQQIADLDAFAFADEYAAFGDPPAAPE